MSADDRGLTLYEIEQGLAEMMEVREAAETDEERATAEAVILAYVAAEVGKVDGIRGYIRNAEVAVAAAKDEAERQRARAQVWENRVARLKEFCLAVMVEQGATRLDGRTGSLHVQNNGGVLPLEISDVKAVPDECLAMTIKITWATWLRLRTLEQFPVLNIPAPEPDNALIRAAIAESGGIPGAHLGERGKHLRVK